MSSRIYYAKVHKRDIAFIRFIFEGYETVGNVRTLDAVRGYLEFIVSSDFDDTFHFVIDSLKREIPLALIPRPAGYDSLGDSVPSEYEE